jgi:hypothetical protein
MGVTADQAWLVSTWIVAYVLACLDAEFADVKIR